MLSPYTVLDLTNDRGELAAMILGDLGADVIKIEPPDGSSSRRMAPFLENALEPERSLYYLAFNRNKRGTTLDLAVDAGRRALMDLVKIADFVIESGPPGEMSRLGVGFDEFRRINPRIVYVAITPYGQDGPHADFAASDLALAAMGGPMSVQGTADRAPLRISVPQVWLHAAGEAAVAALTAHARMLVTDEAQFVDVSAQTAITWTMLNGMTAYAIQGSDFNRAGGASQTRGFELQVVFKCADGYVAVLPIGATLTTLIRWCVKDELIPETWTEDEDWTTYDVKLSAGEPVSHALEEVLATINRYFLEKPKNQVLEKCLQEGVSIAPINTIAELTRFKQLEERGFWLNALLPNGQELPIPGFFARLNNSPMKVRRWSPKLGQHNNEVLGGLLGYSSSQIGKACGSAGSDGQHT